MIGEPVAQIEMAFFAVAIADAFALVIPRQRHSMAQRAQCDDWQIECTPVVAHQRGMRAAHEARKIGEQLALIGIIAAGFTARFRWSAAAFANDPNALELIVCIKPKASNDYDAVSPTRWKRRFDAMWQFWPMPTRGVWHRFDIENEIFRCRFDHAGSIAYRSDVLAAR